MTVCIPHFLEHGARRLPDGEVVVQDNFIEDNFNYKVVYYSIVDPLLRYDKKNEWMDKYFDMKKNIPSGQLSAKLPVIQSLGHSVIRSLGHYFSIFNVATGATHPPTHS